MGYYERKFVSYCFNYTAIYLDDWFRFLKLFVNHLIMLA